MREQEAPDKNIAPRYFTFALHLDSQLDIACFTSLLREELGKKRVLLNDEHRL